jgi:hypothetical protein
MKKRAWFRELVKREIKGYKGIKRAVKRLGYKPTLTNRVFLAMGMLKEK